MNKTSKTSITKDWYGNDCPKVTFEVIKSSHWRFKVDVPLAPQRKLLADTGEFYEGLWEQDVAEWFIVNSKTGQYLECNLAANGAWWMMLFSSCRERCLKQPDLQKVRTIYLSNKNSWQAELIIPDLLLTSILGQSDWNYNVCFILGKQPKQYLSLNQLSPKLPDFHRPSEIMTPLNYC